MGWAKILLIFWVLFYQEKSTISTKKLNKNTMRFLISMLINGLLVFIAAKFLSGVAVDGYITAVIVGAVLGLVNMVIKPVITFLTLPLSIITLGLFMLVINGLMVLLVDSMIHGFAVDGIWWAIGFSVLLSILNMLFASSEKKKK